MSVREQDRSISIKYWLRSRLYSLLNWRMRAATRRLTWEGALLAADRRRKVSSKAAGAFLVAAPDPNAPAAKAASLKDQTQFPGACWMMFRCFEMIVDSRC